MKRMRVGLINTNREPYPLPKGLVNGGLAITGLLADELALKNNFDTYFFSAKDSVTHARLISFDIDSYFLFSKQKILTESYSHKDVKLILLREQLLFTKALEFVNDGNIDLLHVHNNFSSIASLFHLCKKPLLYTCHDPITDHHKFFLENLENVYFVTISKKQAELAQNVGVRVNHTIYDGIDTKLFSFKTTSENNILFVGRLISEKGILDAIKLALLLEKKLKIIGQFDLSRNRFEDNKYIQNSIQKKPEVFELNKIINKSEIVHNYQGSKLLILPEHYEEPFGLVMIEAMACGTPVVAFARGSVSEVIKDGETGFIVNSSDDDIRGNWIIKKTGIEGLCEAVERIYSMPEDKYREMRRACRVHAEKNFTVERMVDEYEKVYEQILSSRR